MVIATVSCSSVVGVGLTGEFADLGAVVVLTVGPNGLLQQRVERYMAQDLGTEVRLWLRRAERSVMARLVSRIAASYDALHQRFGAFEVEHISWQQWATTLTEVLGLRLPWRMVAKHLGGLSFRSLAVYSATTIHWVGWLSKYKPEPLIEGIGSLRKLADALLRHHLPIRSLLLYCDSDGDGMLSAEEFANGLEALNGKLTGFELSASEIKELHALFAPNKGENGIRLSHLLKGFKVACPVITQQLQSFKSLPSQ